MVKDCRTLSCRGTGERLFMNRKRPPCGSAPTVCGVKWVRGWKIGLCDALGGVHHLPQLLAVVDGTASTPGSGAPWENAFYGAPSVTDDLSPSVQITLACGIPEVSTRKLRSKRSGRSDNCSSSEYVPRGKNYCCNKCTRGHYVKSDCGGHGLRTECARCRNGTFLAAENSLRKCKSCTVCDESVLNQIELRTCEAGLDRECGCPKNMYKRWLDDTTFSCENCTLCRLPPLRLCE
ncbi:tumor necrosis factor receptor superfamily member 1A-like [Hypanus sabinus]|uniref:tumor necrosis factor receptor superfamily member 1A-like n=1 Tax=Hypanus sabinus TaxID=79690 RepID=UPI0028C50E00|nr:tumor necrosis factor receptor superfamily member 1A-like [Hypanus sabinus]